MTVDPMKSGGSLKSLDLFKARVEAWAAENLEPLGDAGPHTGLAKDDADQVVRAKAIQRKIWDAGFAGLCYPVEYGGRGLPAEYQNAFNEATHGYELPMLFNTPTFTIILPTILDFGTEEQKQRFIPATLSGEHLWVQFLSEPSGGSDLAGAITRAEREGDVFVLNGSKIWSTYAWKSDYALCVCRTNWDVPKHRGLSVLIVKVHQPGITITQIKHVDGTEEFCQEFFDDVELTDDDVIGKVNDGWTVAQTMLVFERGGGLSHGTRAVAGNEGIAPDLVRLARSVGRLDDPLARDLIVRAHVDDLARKKLFSRLGALMAKDPMQAGNLACYAKLAAGVYDPLRATTAMRIGGADAVSWDEAGTDEAATDAQAPAEKTASAYLNSRFMSIAGGTNEMQRNGVE
nr:acyl-CoA dehydrogenase family protein [Micromonospora sp. DSM 115978]